MPPQTPGLGQRLNASDWVTLLSAFGPAALSAIGGAGQSAAERQRQAEIDAWTRAQADYQRRQSARSGLANFYADQMNRQGDAARSLANVLPLGAEQDLALRMSAMRGLTQAGQNYNPQANIPGFMRERLPSTPNYFETWTRPDVMAAISPEATARSIAERRKVAAGIDPNFQFGNMGDYGVPDLGGEVGQYAGAVRGRQQASENTLLGYLQQQMQEAQQPLMPASGTQTGQPAAEKKTPWWKRALKVAATAAPIVAAPFTGGTSLALIGAGAGALAGGLDGGLKGALTGGALGAATAGLGGGAAARGAGESARSAIQRAILNPQALARLAGAGIGGTTGQALTAASMALPGARPYAPASYEIGPPSELDRLVLNQAAGLKAPLPSRPLPGTGFTGLVPGVDANLRASATATMGQPSAGAASSRGVQPTYFGQTPPSFTLPQGQTGPGGFNLAGAQLPQFQAPTVPTPVLAAVNAMPPWVRSMFDYAVARGDMAGAMKVVRDFAATPARTQAMLRGR